MNTHSTPARSRHFRRLAIAALALTPLTLTACAAGEATPTDTAPAATESASDGLAFTAPWAKAADGMSGVFGTLENGTDAEVTLTEAESPRAGLVELHETTMVDGQMIMREIDGGFTIPAGGTFELAPGEDHIMLMELDSELLPGEVLPVTLTFSNGETLSFDIDVREFAGAEENYGDLEHHDHDDHADHGDHEADGGDDHGEHDE